MILNSELEIVHANLNNNELYKKLKAENSNLSDPHRIFMHIKNTAILTLNKNNNIINPDEFKDIEINAINEDQIKSADNLKITQAYHLGEKCENVPKVISIRIKENSARIKNPVLYSLASFLQINSLITSSKEDQKNYYALKGIITKGIFGYRTVIMQNNLFYTFWQESTTNGVFWENLVKWMIKDMQIPVMLFYTVLPKTTSLILKEHKESLDIDGQILNLLYEFAFTFSLSATISNDSDPIKPENKHDELKIEPKIEEEKEIKPNIPNETHIKPPSQQHSTIVKTQENSNMTKTDPVKPKISDNKIPVKIKPKNDPNICEMCFALNSLDKNGKCSVCLYFPEINDIIGNIMKNNKIENEEIKLHGNIMKNTEIHNENLNQKNEVKKDKKSENLSEIIKEKYDKYEEKKSEKIYEINEIKKDEISHEKLNETSKNKINEKHEIKKDDIKKDEKSLEKPPEKIENKLSINLPPQKEEIKKPEEKGPTYKENEWVCEKCNQINYIPNSKCTRILYFI